MDKKSAEMVVKVFSIIGIVLSALMALGGLMLLVGGSAFIGGLGGLGFLAGLAAAGGVIMLVLGLLFVWFYMQLMKYVNWARILMSVFAVLGFIGAIFSLPASIVSLIFNGLFVYFFLISKDVVKLYK